MHQIDKKYKYDGKLGYIYTKEKTTFKLFAPTALKVELLLEDEVFAMLKDEKTGVYSVEVNKDIDGFKYMYKTYFEDVSFVTEDPYAIASSANSEKSVVVNLSKTNPENFDRMPKFNDLDAIIYELHVRDFTLKAKHSGKYLGVVEEKQLNYLKDLGITHVQILPFYDYSTDSVDELNPDLRYNWGYDPVNYNVPEGSYSTDASNPYSRIKELKQMIKVLHDNGIRVIMDVVYNHVYDALAHSFSKTVPNYCFRMLENGEFSNGTACGNDVASERAYVSKYIVDSVVYWAKEYNLDGFRFDLMGILDIHTMNKIRQEVDKIDPSIMLLGEGWDLNTHLDSKLKANQNNANKMDRIAFFNDDIRDGIRGNTFERLDKGYISGNFKEERLTLSIKGGKGLKTYTSPRQLIQYIEAHDNNTVFDHIMITNEGEKIEDVVRMEAIGTSLILTSQGIPFIHAGQEFFRTKDGVENSYKSSDHINRFDFDRAKEYQSYVKYFADLIAYRKEQELFKLPDYKTIDAKFKYIDSEENILAYILDEKIFVIANVSKEISSVILPSGSYKLKFENFAKQDKVIKVEKEFKLDRLNFVILEKMN